MKKARADADLAATCAINEQHGHSMRFCDSWEPMTQAQTHVKFFLPHRRHDTDGLSAWMKPYWDGIADADVIANDRGFSHSEPVVEIEKDKTKTRVEITIVELY